MLRSLSISLFVLLGSAHSAFSCEEMGFDRLGRATILPSCEFKHAGYRNYFRGRPAVKVGNGKVAQGLVSSPTCPYQEKLLVADCHTVQAISIDGIMDPDVVQRAKRDGVVVWLGGDYEIKYIQPPYGPIALSRSTQFDDLVRVADINDLKYDLDIHTTVQSFRPQNRFDVFCGCKVFYPNSAGAKE